MKRSALARNVTAPNEQPLHAVNTFPIVRRHIGAAISRHSKWQVKSIDGNQLISDPNTQKREIS